MPNCIVSGCTSKKNKRDAMKGVILHVFPPNLDRIKVWLLQTGQDFGNLDEFAKKVLDGKRTDAYRLCSVHFTPQCYLDRASKKALRVDAVPTIFHNRDGTCLNCVEKHRLKASGNDNNTISQLSPSNIPSTISNTFCSSKDDSSRTEVYSKTKEESKETHPRLSTKTVKSPKWKALPHVVTDLQRITEIRKNFTKRMLELTLEIIYLLTGEGYEAVKNISEHVTPHMSGGWSKAQSHVMETPFLSLTPERNYKKILDVTNKITKLLTGEVPVKFQDVTVYFSMEELQYLEEPKNVVVEKLHYQGENVVIKVEVKDELGELNVKGGEMCMDEESPPEISPDPGDTRDSQRDIKVKEEEGGPVWIKEEEVPVEISTKPGYNRANHRNVKDEEKDEGYVRIKEQEIPPEISPGGKYKPVINSFSLHDSEADDGITDDSSDESPAAPNSNPELDSTHLLPDPPPSFSDHSYPIPHHADGREGDQALSSENSRHPHLCSICKKSFSDKFALRQHEKTHKWEMPYYCLQCGKDYLHKSRFISHRRIHTGEKPYSCSKCGKSFANKPDLVRHHRTHTGEKPFSCSDCGKRFTQRVHLVTHQKKHVLQKL